VVEDEPDVAELIRYNLAREGYDVLQTSNGADALRQAHDSRPDLLLLDLMIPQLNGWEVCRRLKQDPATRAMPVIILTARVEEGDKVLGFEMGADDYVTKPFAVRELLARVRAVIRRSVSAERGGKAHQLMVGDLEIDRRRFEVTMKGRPVLLGALLALVFAAGAPPASAQMLMNGAGATFPYPLYSKWFDEYTKVDPSVRFNYQSIGSGGGIRQITARTVDFGATDGPMTDEQLKAAKGELFHIPTVLGADVATYNLPGNPKLHFTPDVLADIFLGKITKWNDPRLTAINAGVSLPSQPIVVVHRSDGSGTTYIWVDYLSKVSPEWAQKVGRGTSVNWPVGLGGKGNEGVAGQVKNTPGALGYVELAYAVQNKLPAGATRNEAGKFVEPMIDSTTAAAAAAGKDMPADFRVSLTNPPGADAYPVASFTWILVYRDQPDEAKGRALAKFLWWAAHEGQKYAKDLLYAPLPPPVVKQIEAKLREIRYQGKPVLAAAQ
jgi:phosphate transport system substrate-binding protein